MSLQPYSAAAKSFPMSWLSDARFSASTRFLHPHHTNPVLLFGHLAPFVGCMAASAGHSSSSFRSQAMHPPSPAQGLRQKAVIGAVEK